MTATTEHFVAQLQSGGEPRFLVWGCIGKHYELVSLQHIAKRQAFKVEAEAQRFITVAQQQGGTTYMYDKTRDEVVRVRLHTLEFEVVKIRATTELV